jgi:hypothetical protein
LTTDKTIVEAPFRMFERIAALGRVGSLRSTAMRRSSRLVVQSAAVTCFAASSLLGGASIVVPVAQDESVNSGFADKNYADNTNRGGLFVGCDGTTGVARFYLQFVLPDFIRHDQIEKATLSAVYQDDLDRENNGVHRIHFVAADDWKEDTITWANQPGPTYGSAEALFDSASAKLGETEKWDVTDLAKAEIKGDGKLSLMFAASNESLERSNRNWEYFAENEFDPTNAFKLTLATNTRVGGGGGPVAVPLPAAVVPALMTFAGATLIPTARRMLKRRFSK